MEETPAPAPAFSVLTSYPVLVHEAAPVYLASAVGHAPNFSSSKELEPMFFQFLDQ